MLRRFTSRKTATTLGATTASATSSSSSSLVQSRASITGLEVAGPFLAHLSSISAVSSTNLMYTPLGTAALVAMAYNVNLVGLKHLWYTSELPARDYVQDAALKQVIRYLMLISLLFTANGLFCEC